MSLRTFCTFFFLLLLAACSNQAEKPLIVRLGAQKGGDKICTDAIQQAIDQTSDAGGGRVLIPKGTWLVGTLKLKSGVELHLEQGATLLGSTDTADYRPERLIYAKGCRDIALTGLGTIDGQGHKFWVKKEAPWAKRKYQFGWVPQFAYTHPYGHNEVKQATPGNLVELVDCQKVALRDLTLKNSERWTCHLTGCDNISISGITIRNRAHGPNVDGIDLEACRNATVTNCDIRTADDAFCLKNREPEYHHRTCQNITVSNCLFSTSCNGFKIGTGTHGDFRNITVSNCVIQAIDPERDTTQKTAAATAKPGHYGNVLAPLSGIAIETVDGGDLQGVSISNIVMDEVRTPIFIRLGNRGGRYDQHQENSQPGHLRDVKIEHLTAFNCYTASSITGLPGYPVENISLRDITLYTRGDTSQALRNKTLEEKAENYPEATMWGRMPVGGFYLRHVKNLSMEKVEVNFLSPEKRPLMHMEDVAGAYIRRLRSNDNYLPNRLIRRDSAIRRLVVQEK